MPSISTYTIAAMALLSAVQAGFYTTYPVGADTVNPGQSIVIKWRPDEQEPVLTNVRSYTLKFMTGGNLVQTTVSTIGTFDISRTEIPFTIPNTAPGMYFLMYTAEGSGSSWSTRFSVGGGTTWYPEGVATGMDPGTSSTDSGNGGGSQSSSDEGSKTDSRSAPEPSSDPTSSERDTGSSSEISSSQSSGGSSETSSPTESSKSDTTVSSVQQTTDSGAQENTDTTADQENTDDVNSDEQPEEENTDSADEGEESQSEQASETDEEPSSSEEESSSSGAAYRYLSVAALVVASVFMI